MLPMEAMRKSSASTSVNVSHLNDHDTVKLRDQDK